MVFKNKKIAILGWGINGLDAYNFLKEKDADIAIYDHKDESDLELSQVDKRKVKLILGKYYLKYGLRDFDYIFRAPGVYRYLPQIVDAEKKGVVVTSVIKVFFELCPAKIIGVTGTKGKGTTSTLIYKILKECRKDVYLAGNIGMPVLGLLQKLNDNSIIVLELSSFQLIDLEKSPSIAVVLNITEDHLDWHKNRNEYVEAKRNIVSHKGIISAVINNDYKTSKDFVSSADKNANVSWFSVKRRVKGCFVNESREIILNLQGHPDSDVVICKTGDLLLRGLHNWENACAAVCAASLAVKTIDNLKIKAEKVLMSFKGLEHRLELVGGVAGVKFYNDSFSTNPQTTIAALKSFDEPLTLILGGSDKGLNYDDMGKVISSRENVVNIVLIGDIAYKIRDSLLRAGYSGKILELAKSGMSKIIEQCIGLTPKGGIVLLSPATASFDMFEDYKDRGKQFKNAVIKLSKSSGSVKIV